MLDNIPNLNELHAFVQVVQAGSFAKAAEKIGVTSSALSQNVKNLEKQLGLRLLNRTTRSISPTDAGAKLLADISPHFAAITQGIRHLDELRDTPQGTIRINTSELAANWIIYPKLLPFLAEHPHIQVELMIDNRWVDIVAEGYDMGVRLGYALYKDVIGVRISEPARMALVASPAYLAGKSAVEKIEDLNAHTLIGMRLSNDHQQDEWEFMVDGQKAVYRPQARFSVNNGLRHQAALDGLGIAWLPHMVVQADLEAGRLVEILPETAYTYDPLYLYYPNRKGHSKAFEMIINVLKWQDR